MVKKESNVKSIASPVGQVYARLSDLRNLQTLKERLQDPQVQTMMAQQIPADKMDMVKSQLEKLEFTEDTVQIDSPLGGKISLSIVEREEPKLLKFAAEGSPIPLYLWIQLLPSDEQNCRMKVTVGAEVNFLMQAMVNKPLQQAADGLAQMLSAIPY